MNKEEEKYMAKIILLMFRCGYLSDKIGKSPLTKKGKGFLPSWFWVGYNNFMCAISKKHNNEVRKILLHFYNQDAN